MNYSGFIFSTIALLNLGFSSMSSATDTYEPATQNLTIPQVVVNNTVYSNVVLKLNDFEVLKVDPQVSAVTKVNDYRYQFGSAKLQGNQLTVTFTVTSEFLNRTTTFGNWSGQGKTLLTDNKGNNYTPSSIQVGNDKTSRSFIDYPLVADIPATVIMTFDNVATNATGIGLLEIVTSNQSQSQYLDTNYQVRNVLFE